MNFQSFPPALVILSLIIGLPLMANQCAGGPSQRAPANARACMIPGQMCVETVGAGPDRDRKSCDETQGHVLLARCPPYSVTAHCEDARLGETAIRISFYKDYPGDPADKCRDYRGRLSRPAPPGEGAAY